METYVWGSENYKCIDFGNFCELLKSAAFRNPLCRGRVILSTQIAFMVYMNRKQPLN